MATVADYVLTAQLRDELSVPAGDDDRIKNAATRAKAYVNAAVGDADLSADVWADCVVACACDLYNARNARMGVMDVGTDGVEAYRVPTDPLRAVWPKLNAVGILTGGSVIA